MYRWNLCLSLLLTGCCNQGLGMRVDCQGAKQTKPEWLLLDSALLVDLLGKVVSSKTAALLAPRPLGFLEPGPVLHNEQAGYG
jgi:hypothetical protein